MCYVHIVDTWFPASRIPQLSSISMAAPLSGSSTPSRPSRCAEIRTPACCCHLGHSMHTFFHTLVSSPHHHPVPLVLSSEPQSCCCHPRHTRSTCCNKYGGTSCASSSPSRPSCVQSRTPSCQCHPRLRGTLGTPNVEAPPVRQVRHPVPLLLLVSAEQQPAFCGKRGPSVGDRRACRAVVKEIIDTKI